MKKQQYKITYKTDSNVYHIWATGTDLKTAIDRLLNEHKTIIGIERA